MRRLALLLAFALAVGACSKGTQHNAKPLTPSTTPRSAIATPTSIASTTVVVAPAPNGCDASTLTRAQPRKDRTRYAIDAAVDLAANEVRGTMKAAFTPDRSTDHIVLRLWPNGPTPAAKGGHMSLADATLDGVPVGLSLSNPTTALAATAALAPSHEVHFAVSFSITLPRNLDDRLSHVGNTVRLGSWLPLLPWEPTVGWALDPPTTSNAEASTSIHSDFDVKLKTIPPGLAILGSGTTDEMGHFTADAMPDFAATIGEFNIAQGKAGDVVVVVGVDKTLNESPAAYLNHVTASITELARRYGRYPWPGYSLAVTPNLKGGIEYPGHVMQGPGTNTRTTPHEVAHQWFYALVGSDQGRDPWLDEGLASWAETQVDHSYQSFLAKSIPTGGAGRLGESMPYWDHRHGDYYRSVYVQTVHALGALGVSTAAIDCALARYVAANAYRVALPKDVADSLKTVAPLAEAVLARFGIQRL